MSRQETEPHALTAEELVTYHQHRADTVARIGEKWEALGKVLAPTWQDQQRWHEAAASLIASQEREIARLRRLQPVPPEPVDMVLFCPKCGAQHVDAPEEAFASSNGKRTMTTWTNPPHRSHLCHACGHIWRPADIPTNGVAAIKTRGKADAA